MSWPNSIAITRPLPGLPSTFPGPPANDNWRMPRTNVPVPRPPANDNFPRRSRGLKLPGVLRGLPVLNAFLLGHAIVDIWMSPGGDPTLVVPAGWQVTRDCANGVENVIAIYNTFCAVSAQFIHQYDGRPTSVPMYWNSFSTGNLVSYRNQETGFINQDLSRAFTWVGPGEGPETNPAARPRFESARNSRILPRTAAEPYPGFYPPLLQPVPFAPPVLPGRYKSPKQIMPEWPDAGYGPRPAPRQRTLKSERPPRRTKERKVRARDYAIGRTIEWLVSQATEGLDFQRALFEALPWWRKIALYKAARRLELEYNQGRIVRGRLHYVDLTPDAKMQAIYDYIDEIDVAQAVENVIKQQLTDMFWAEIGNRMGRYQVGPWDDHGYRGPEEQPDWEYYVPDTAPDTAHNHWTYETLVNRRLTRQEAERIHRRYDQYRSQLYEG